MLFTVLTHSLYHVKRAELSMFVCPAEGETVTGSNMYSHAVLLLKTEPVTTNKPYLSTVLIPTENKIQTSIHTSTGGLWFHAVSFIGGMMLAFVIIMSVALGYKLACSQREVRYRAIEEHDAII
ncbi:porimin [Myxocyprinus asiaticus]|uniref:porimin n=1 Tax=Myxocyprinus asiaticus TaxID=70543 RepID=UPI0022234966|nr:porimin [Myxocyprinus asiaticus]